MLDVFDTTELAGLVEEYLSFRIGTLRNKAKNDFIDSNRYAISSISFDFSDLDTKSIKVRKVVVKEEQKRRNAALGIGKFQGDSGVDEELGFWDGMGNEFSD